MKDIAIRVNVAVPPVPSYRVEAHVVEAPGGARVVVPRLAGDPVR